MDNKGLVSVCVLTYNHETYVMECINAILRQTYQNFEGVIVDDGSSDQTLQHIHKCTQNIKQKYIIHTQEHTGHVSRNINILLSQAKGEFIYLISMDDVIREKSLEIMVNILHQDKSIQFCAGDRNEVIDQNSKKIRTMRSLYYNKDHHQISVQDLFTNEIKGDGWFFSQSCLFRKSIINAVDGCDERYDRR